jgi:hypothetical protein
LTHKLQKSSKFGMPFKTLLAYLWGLVISYVKLL